MKLGIKSKLLIMLLGVSIASISVVSVLSYFESRDALSEKVTDQLNGSTDAIRAQIESYFATIEGQAFTLAEDRMIVEAMLEFGVGWDQLADSELSTDETAALDDEYRSFVDELPVAGPTDTVEEFRPDGSQARALQSRYIVEVDPNDRAANDDAGDGTFYSRAHRRYHPALRNYIDQFGFYDLFLIDAETTDILYSVEKEIDFATNLISGPHRNTNLARLVADIRSNPQPGRVEFVDYEFYSPSMQAPAAFVASPVINPNDGEVIGVVALQFPVDQIDEITNSNAKWEQRGLGDTGAAYLVGPDLTMRSEARALIEDPEAYLRELEDDVSDELALLIDTYRSTILLQPVDTPASRLALNGETGSRVGPGYLGEQTLSSYAPLEISGLQWGIVTQLDIDEANEPVNDLQRKLLIATGLLVLILTALAMLLSAVFVRPINKLIGWSEAVADGDFDAEVEVGTNDEFGELGSSFNSMVGTLKRQRDEVLEKNAEHDRLLVSIMPSAIADRLKKGEERIADEYPSVTIVHADVTGFDRFTLDASAGQAADVLDDLATRSDELCAQHGVERVKIHGTQLIAACGLLRPRLDHQRKAIDFARELRSMVEDFSASRDDLEFSAVVGISAGVVEAGIVSRTRPVFDVWGPTVSNAEILCDAAEPGEILVTVEVSEHLDGQYTFVEHPPVGLEWADVTCASLVGDVDHSVAPAATETTVSS